MPRTILISLALLVIVGTIIALEMRKAPRGVQGLGGNAGDEQHIIPMTQPSPDKEKKYPRAREIASPHGFINADSVSLADLIGKKIILVDFWTYSCINCQRTTPFLNAWQEKYSDRGLAIIGVHTPEFAFEGEYDNVKRAVEQFGIRYPVVLDNDYATWHAYGNRYWPRKYLIDIDGFIVYDHIGEGGYAETEKKIQELLAERQDALGQSAGTDAGKNEGTVQIPDHGETGTRSPEIYFGASRNTYLGNGTSGATGPQTFEEPAGIKANILYLAGRWNFSDEYAESAGADAKIIFRYRAKNVYMVASADSPIEVTITRDGKALGVVAGADVSESGGVSRASVRDARLYRLIEDSEYEEHTLEIMVSEAGFRAFTFTFG